MANVADVPEPHRRLAARVPPDILAKMSSVELRARCAEVDRLLNIDAADPALFIGYRDLARKYLEALPYAERQAKAEALRNTARSMPSAVDASAFFDAAAAVEADNPQPPNLAKTLAELEERR